MIFKPTKLDGVFVVELEKKTDERGFLARSWDKDEFVQHGIKFDPVEGYSCESSKKGTLRGLHFVVPPYQETKLTRVIRGSLYDVVVDLRPNSPTFKQWLGFTFRASDYKMLLTPAGCAHAILTLEDDTEYTSFYSLAYDPKKESGIRFDDPGFNITWPITPKIISEKDKSWPDFKAQSY